MTTNHQYPRGVWYGSPSFANWTRIPISRGSASSDHSRLSLASPIRDGADVRLGPRELSPRYPRGVWYGSHHCPQRKACRNFGSDRRSLAVLCTRLTQFSSGRVAGHNTGAMIWPPRPPNFGLRPFSRAISKGNGREACDDPAVRFSSRGGVEGHAIERSLLVIARASDAAGPGGDTRKRPGRRRNHAAGRRGESLRWEGQGASCQVWPHEPQPDAITQPRRSELGAGIKPGPREAFSIPTERRSAA